MHQSSATAALLLGLITCAGTPALGQCAFDQSSPNANEVLRDPQPVVTLDFTDAFDLQEVRLVGPDNAEWPIDWARTREEVRTTEFRVTRPLPPGRYMIEWNGYLRRHYHADGGSIPFTVAAAGDAPPDASPANANPANASLGAAPPAGAAPRSGKGSPYPAFLGAGAPQAGR